MDFILSIPSNNLITVNRQGTVAVCTLWTPPDYVAKKLRAAAPHLFEAESPLAVIGGLYGGGLKILLRNLLYNPQIDTVVICGKDFSGAGGHLAAFFRGAIERTGQTQSYIFDDGHIENIEKIAICGGDSKYYMDALVSPYIFYSMPTIVVQPFKSDFAIDMAAWFRAYHAAPSVPLARQKIPLPLPELSAYPSLQEGHSITANTILEAWPQLLFRLTRFGIPARFRNGKLRHELLNMKVVIKTPANYSKTALEKYNISIAEMQAYQHDIVNNSVADTQENYTYGNRLGAYFGRNLLEAMARDVSIDTDSRQAFITLWDNTRDGPGRDNPCLVTLFFRKIQHTLNLTATFRTHNATRAWPLNCFGLLAIMEHVCGLANENPDKTERHTLSPGTLTVFSQSISIDPRDFEQIDDIVDEYRQGASVLYMDPNGYFRLSVDRATHEIVVQHYTHEDELCDEYRGKTPSDLSRQLYTLAAISDMGHALYMGGQLERAWFCLEHGVEYVQDKATVLRTNK